MLYKLRVVLHVPCRTTLVVLKALADRKDLKEFLDKLNRDFPKKTLANENPVKEEEAMTLEDMRKLPASSKTGKVRCLQNVGLATSNPEFESNGTYTGVFKQDEVQIINTCARSGQDSQLQGGPPAHQHSIPIVLPLPPFGLEVQPSRRVKYLPRSMLDLCIEARTTTFMLDSHPREDVEVCGSQNLKLRTEQRLRSFRTEFLSYPLGCHKDAEIKLELMSSEPISYKPYRLSYAERMTQERTYRRSGCTLEDSYSEYAK
ncbi:hypothetical protein Trydic_g12530 [Trypoxylus dichotomus]